jgi:hypothetical protein
MKHLYHGVKTMIKEKRGFFTFPILLTPLKTGNLKLNHPNFFALPFGVEVAPPFFAGESEGSAGVAV